MQVLNDNETLKYVGGAFYFYLSIFDERVAHSVCISDKA